MTATLDDASRGIQALLTDLAAEGAPPRNLRPVSIDMLGDDPDEDAIRDVYADVFRGLRARVLA